MSLLTISTYKINKGKKLGVLTGILHLLPADQGGHGNVCPWSTAGCREACLVSAGRGKTNVVKKGRQRKTDLFFEDRSTFLELLHKDIRWIERKAIREGMIPAVRLNGTSDLPFERIAPHLFSDFPNVVFYDYTKSPDRIFRNTLPNYHLTYSRSEKFESELHAINLLGCGFNVAIVFSGGLPPEWMGHPVIDGDEHDCRFMDPPGVVVGLTPKGRAARLDKSGFVLA